jgi:[ribosomal protein S5]-alanine N-acetyltransferase
VVVRKWRADDLAGIAEAASDPYIAPIWAVPALDDEVGAERWLAAQAETETSGRGFSRAIAARGKPASGQVGLTLRGEDRPSIYYWLAGSGRGRGVAERAVRVLAHWALNELAAPALEARVEPDNVASRRLLGRIGFTEECLLRSFTLFGERRVDVVMYSLLPSDPAAATIAELPWRGSSVGRAHD